jgi:thymidylate synthase (FAD)
LKIYINEIFSLEDFKISIPFTALGARTCYSAGDLDYLLNDPRVVSQEDRAKFLSKLGNYKHFSVFAHSFAYKDLTTLDEKILNKYLEKEFLNLSKEKKAEILALKIASTHFKSHYNSKYPSVIGVSLRHYLEDLLDYSEEEYFKSFEKIAEYDVSIKPLGKREKTTLIGLLKDYDGYAVFYIDNVSRTMTHQLVRHTALNYSQRSQRYVREDENLLIIPPSIKNSDCEIKNDYLTDNYKAILEEFYKELSNEEKFKEEYKKSLEKVIEKLKDLGNNSISLEQLFEITDKLNQTIYEYAVYRCKVKREDARFILPHGRKTTIVVSGTISWLKDFIVKRTDPHAQWEIRQVANEMKELLEEQGVI